MTRISHQNFFESAICNRLSSGTSSSVTSSRWSVTEKQKKQPSNRSCAVRTFDRDVDVVGGRDGWKLESASKTSNRKDTSSLSSLFSSTLSLSLSLTNTYAHIHAHALWMSDRMCVRVCDVLARHLLSFRRGLPASEPTVALEVEQKQNEK